MKKKFYLNTLLLLSGIVMISSCKSGDTTTDKSVEAITEQSTQLKELQDISAALKPFGTDISKGLTSATTLATLLIEEPESGESAEDSTTDNETHFKRCSLLASDNTIVSRGSFSDGTPYKSTITVLKENVDDFCKLNIISESEDNTYSYKYKSILESTPPSGNTFISESLDEVKVSLTHTIEGSVQKYEIKEDTHSTGKTTISDGTMNLNIDSDITYSYVDTKSFPILDPNKEYTNEEYSELFSPENSAETNDETLTGNYLIYFNYNNKEYTTQEIPTSDFEKIDDEPILVKFSQKDNNTEVGYIELSKDGSISIYDLDKKPVSNI